MADQTINLSKIECIPPKNTISTLNQFIINTVDFINKFAYFSEEKLICLDENIDRLETQLILLEKKLETIPPEYFANVDMKVTTQTYASPQNPTITEANNPGNSNISSPPPPPPPPPPGNTTVNQSSGGLPPPPPPPINLLLAGGAKNLPPPPPPPPVNQNNNENPAGGQENNNEENKPAEENKNELPGNFL